MFIRKLAERTWLIGLLISAFTLSSFPEAYASPILLNSSLGTGCATSVSNGFRYTNRYVATSNVAVSAVNLLIGTGSSTNFNSSYVYIYSDNPSLNQPATVLETFTPNAIVGSGQLTTLNYVGSRQFTAGSKFWIVPSSPTSSIPQCYYTTANVSNMTFAGVIPDTSTTNSNTSFSRAYAAGASLFPTASWTVAASPQIWQLSIEGLPSEISATIGLQSSSKVATYRISTVIRVSVNASSRATFYHRNKVIPNCRNIVSVGGVIDCNWKPNVIGANTVYARLTSLDGSYSNLVTNQFEVLVSKRTNTR